MSKREDLIYQKIAEADKKAGISATPKEEVFFFPSKADAAIAKHFLKEGRNGRLIEMISKREAVPLNALELLRKLHLEEQPEEIDRMRKMGPDQ